VLRVFVCDSMRGFVCVLCLSVRKSMCVGGGVYDSVRGSTCVCVCVCLCVCVCVFLR
jgi:hypothetical protein